MLAQHNLTGFVLDYEGLSVTTNAPLPAARKANPDVTPANHNELGESERMPKPEGGISESSQLNVTCRLTRLRRLVTLNLNSHVAMATAFSSVAALLGFASGNLAIVLAAAGYWVGTLFTASISKHSVQYALHLDRSVSGSSASCPILPCNSRPQHTVGEVALTK